MEKTGKMPAASHALTMSWKNERPPAPPHELLTTFGLRSGRGLFPSRSVGAMIHCPDASSDVWVHDVNSQPLAAIHRAPGATPTWLAPPSARSSPTMVPMVWVPCPLLSHGARDGLPHVCEGSYQL